MLRFSLLGVPVGVHITFLFVAVLGATAYSGFEIVLWTIAAFVSILMHEMGHALMAKRYGAVGITVTLYGLGGVTNFRHSGQLSHGRSFLISAAGSAVGIAAGGAVLFAGRAGAFASVSDGVLVLLNSFVFTALVWGILNWVPIVPLDGGHMLLHLVSIVNKDKAPLISQIVTWIAVAIIVPIALLNGFEIAAILVVLFAASGLREYRDTARQKRGTPHGQAAHMPLDSDEPQKPSEPPEFPI